MTSTLIKVLAISVLLLIGACAANNRVIEQSAPNDLNQWVNGELIPYAVKQLSSHPKFKHQSVLIVSMEGDQIQADIDDLTRDIRQRLVDALLETPGIHLVWHPGVSASRDYRRADDIPCVESRKIRYYVGLDVDFSPWNGTLEVSLRALDLIEKNWVSGFQLSWRGVPSRSQRQALARRQSDDTIRGHRLSPLKQTEPDLLAAQLAQSLGCYLRHNSSLDNAVIYVEPPDSRVHPFFLTALGLLDNYLTRFREVQVSDDPKQANIVLNTEINHIHENLHQVWVAIRNTEDGRLLTGTETVAYVHIDSSPFTVAHKQDQSSQRPIISAESASESLESSGRRRHRATPLIDAFHLLTPVRPSHCNTGKPWQFEFRPVARNERLGYGTCLAVEVSVNQPVRLMIAAQDHEGKLIWILPSPCKARFARGIPLESGESFRYWLPTHTDSALGLKYKTRETRIYAIAIAQPASFDSAKVNHHGVTTPPSLCQGRRLSSLSRSVWQTYFDSLISEHGAGLDWQTIRF